MSGAPIRAAIVVAAVVAGALVISLGFPASGTLISAPPSTKATSSPSATPSAPATHKTTPSAPKGHAQGVVLAVFNTTTVVGLAACAATDLSKLGYVVPAKNLENAPPGSQASQSQIFFRNAQGKSSRSSWEPSTHRRTRAAAEASRPLVPPSSRPRTLG
jgi:hypothetical protein